MEILKIIGVAFVTAICSLLVKTTKPELSFAVNTVGVLVILFQILTKIPQISECFMRIGEISGMENGMIKLLLKMVAIGYLTEFSSGLLTDFGSVALADKVVLAGKITIILMSLPIFDSLLRIMQAFLHG
jgi:stage III sporulation protein AD